MKRVFSSLFISVLAYCSVWAQINPTVEVTRKFDVSLQDIHKPVLPTAVADSLRRFDVTFDYSIFNRPYDDLYDFIPYESVQISTVAPKKAPVFVAKIGSQYQLAPSAEVYFQGGKNSFYGTLYATHSSFWGDVEDASFDGQRMDLGRMRNAAGGSMTYDWQTGNLLVDAKYRYDSYNYSRENAEIFHSASGFDVSANLTSAHAEETGVYYDFLLGYRISDFGNLDNSSLLGENFLKLSGSIGGNFDIHRVYIDMNVQYAAYDGEKDFAAGVFEFSPIYQLDTRRLSAKLGVKFGNRYGTEKKDTGEKAMEPLTNFFPNVDARYEIIRNGMWIRAILNGGNDLNVFSDMQEKMPVLLPSSDIVFGVRQLDSKFSLESLLYGRLAVNLSAYYGIYDHSVYFAPRLADNGFYDIVSAYRDFNELSYGAELIWSSESLDAGGLFRYNTYFADSEVTEFPAIEAQAHIRYNYRERVSTSIDFRFTGEVSGNIFGEYSVPAVVDMDFNMGFMLNRHISLFAKCGNLLDRRNQYMPLYIEPGRNFGGGVCVNF